MTPTESLSKPREGYIRFFSPYTRSLSPEEISPEERQRTEAGDRGVWLEVECPRNNCIISNERISIEVRCVEEKKEGLWHKLFCPEDKCFAQSASEVPS